METKGEIHLYTGDGKGKTTASMGLILRARGAGLSCIMIQFLKKGDFSEVKVLESIGVTVLQYGASSFYNPVHSPYLEYRKFVRDGFDRAMKALEDSECNLVVLDEIIDALNYDLITFDEVLALLKSRPDNMELVLTGRDAPSALYEYCSLVTDVKCVKHYFEKGIMARKGIEF